MRGQSVIRELYQGNLRPCDLRMEQNEDYALYMQDISKYGAWLEEHLEGKAKRRYKAIVELYDGSLRETAYEHFRSGLCLGLALMASVAEPRGDIFFE